MRVPINKITKELEIKSFQLHKWEERGWLGTEPVLKDPDNNGQRIYSKQQVEHIEFINEIIKDQKKRGIHRTDPKEMEKLLLEKFGGEVTSPPARVAAPPRHRAHGTPSDRPSD